MELMATSPTKRGGNTPTQIRGRSGLECCHTPFGGSPLSVVMGVRGLFPRQMFKPITIVYMDIVSHHRCMGL